MSDYHWDEAQSNGWWSGLWMCLELKWVKCLLAFALAALLAGLIVVVMVVAM